MKVCKYCGADNDNSALCCTSCGKMLENEDNYDSGVSYGTASVGWWFIGFFCFIAGFVLSGVLANKMPDAAHKAKMGAIVGVIVNVVYIIVYIALVAATMF